MSAELWLGRLGLLASAGTAVLALAWLMAAGHGLFAAWSAGELDSGAAWWRLVQAVVVALLSLLWMQTLWSWHA